MRLVRAYISTTKDTVGKNTKRIKNYIVSQLKENQESEQLTLDLEDLFKKECLETCAQKVGLCPQM